MANQSIFPALVANRPAVSPNLTTPGDTQALQDQYDLQRNQAIAQLLTQQGLEGTPQGQIVGGHYVRPNGFQGMANALKLYLGTKAMDDLPRQQAQVQAGQDQRLAAQFGVGTQPQQQSPDPMQSYPVGPSGVPPQGQRNGGQGPAMGAALRANQPQQEQAPAMPLLPGKTAMESWQVARSLGIPEYMKLVAQQSTLTDMGKNLLSMGVQPGSLQWNQAMSGAVSKAGYIPPTVVAPGSSILQPGANSPSYVAPKDGIQMTMGPNGPQASTVPGYAPANAEIAGQAARATAAGQASQDLVDVPDGQGGTVKMPREQAVQILGSPSGAPGAQGAGGQPNGFGTSPNPKVQEAKTALPQVVANIDQIMNTIDQVEKSPGLGRTVGMMSLFPNAPGSKASDAQAKVDQLKGQTFLQAYQTLKGGGAITEVEGAKAENALARLQNNQSEEGFRSALRDFRQVIEGARTRAYQQARASAPVGMASPSSFQEMQALPSGTVFRAPDGSIRRKP